MGSSEQVFRGVVQSTEGDIGDVEIVGYRSKRGSGDGLIWRGHFTLPNGSARRSVGESLYIRLPDGSLIALVVTEVVGHSVCFRARGKCPEGANNVRHERSSTTAQ